MPVRALLIALSILLLAPVGALAESDPDDLALEAMRAGGVVVLIRHEVTESGIGDPPEFTLGKCETQRNLSASGRERARRLGARLAELGVRVDEVRSSRWCRCVDTAELAFGERLEVQAWPPLDSFFGGQGDRATQTRAALANLSDLPRDGVWVWVTHQVNISALSGEFTAMGEAIVARPRDDGSLQVVGRWQP
ncbi:histidine phosphatase family protein [Pseudazoarcus pumilus]|uniref:Histidine phosphatase family protein n=1 Tax=Pseudazoarcus pumilus TaxID=2067960 RepID=A0A2I6S3L6_9RHOO|nr:histidine phosphatase family protein [Pseudazoarcus pumilus]AUN93856.1 histidine phosphatase family protein [Pseudazoarcus pumilus]